MTPFRYLFIAPTLGAIDMSLSFRTTIRSRSLAPAFVQGLVGEPAPDGAVADHRDDIEVLALVVAANGHAHRGGDRGGGVSGAEDVVLRLDPPQEGSQPILAANGVQVVVSPREDLVDVAWWPVSHTTRSRGVSKT